MDHNISDDDNNATYTRVKSRIDKCFVPMCPSISSKFPNKSFFSIPSDPKRREKWFQAVKRKDKYSLNTVVRCCEDHFDLVNDVANWVKFRLCGGMLSLKKDVVPHIFERQKETMPLKPRSAIMKSTPGNEKRISVSEKFSQQQELDKFKRRLIRAIARLYLHEKKPEEEIWIELKKETGCDCKLLWSRMRALTIKKINLLYAADDYTEKIPKAARMSLTDWLLFDLVLVHQKLDVIGRDLENSKTDPKPLVELYDLVEKFNLECKAGEDLARAWVQATVAYNKAGRECSPMLLQRRWYQLKEATRSQFYAFWYAYRGAVKRLTQAEQHMPSNLQATIARRFKNLVITAFTEWEELIEQKLVITAEEFQKVMNPPSNTSKKPIDDVPDLVVIEPVIETIDLRLDSDGEEKKEDAIEQPQSPPVIKIKEEPLDMDIDIEEHPIEEPKSIFDKALEYTSIEHETIDSIDDNEVNNEESTSKEPEENDTIINEDSNKYHDIAEEQNEIEAAIEFSLRKQQENVLPQISSVSGNIQQTNVNLSEIDTLNASINNATVTDIVGMVENSDTIISNAVDPNIGNRDKCGPDNDTIITLNNPNTNISANICIIDNTAEREIQDADILDTDRVNSDGGTQNRKAPVVAANLADHRWTNTDILDENIPDTDIISVKDANIDIEKVTNTIENLNEDTVMSTGSSDDKPLIEMKPEASDFSFGELSNDINFVEDGIELVDDGIAYQEEENNDDSEIKVKSEEGEDQKDIEGPPKIDEKLLMVPIVYTTRIDDMDLFHTQPFDHVANYKIIDIIHEKSKPVKEVPKAQLLSTDEEEEEAEKEDLNIIDENQRVKVTSNLLQKPRSRTYHPIQLCKNPDFNTRLKRLNIGFFGSQRNLILLKSCKPMTIDLSKAFESKLVDGTLYLKPDLTVKTVITDIPDTVSSQNVTVVPSAMPVQSLIDNTKISDLPLLAPKITPKPPEVPRYKNPRNKIIVLPDITEIRRINQRILTAEVAPIQIQNNKTRVPVSIVASSNSQPSSSGRSTSTPGADATTPTFMNRGPPKLVDITDDTPSVNNVNKSTPWRFMDQNTGFTKIPPKKPAFAPWKPRQTFYEVSWLSKNTEADTYRRNIDETLLTLDTLNKMLYLLSSDKEDVTDLQIPGKKKKKKKKKDPHAKEVSRSADDSDVQIMDDADNSAEQNKKCCKPKINIKPAVNNPVDKKNLEIQKQQQLDPQTTTIDLVQQIDDESDSPEEKHDVDQCTTKKKTRKPAKSRFCCWSRQKMISLLFDKGQLPHHDCPKICRCCCRGLLAQYLVNERKLKEAEKLSKSDEVAVQSITNNTSDITEASLSETPFVISSVQSLLTNPIISTIPTNATNPNISSVRTLTVSPMTSSVETVITNPIISSVESLAEIPITVTSVDRAQTADAATEINSEAPEELTKVVNESEVTDIDNRTELAIADDSIPLGGEVLVTTSVSPSNVKVISGEHSNVRGTNEVGSSVSFKKGRLPVKHVVPVTPSFSKFVEPLPYKLVTKYSPGTVAQYRPMLQKNTDTKKTYSEKNNLHKSAPIINHLKSKKTTLMPKNAIPTTKSFKERILYLNSKQIAQKPSDNPIFLGKNKILLTTVKFPPNLKKFEEAKQLLKPQLKLPHGVQLILLPNGTVTYVVDPKVDVNPSDLTNVPAIVLAVQKQINTYSTPKVMDNEVVDLIDEDENEITGNSDVTPVDGKQMNQVGLAESREKSPSKEAAEVEESPSNEIAEVVESPSKEIAGVEKSPSKGADVKESPSNEAEEIEESTCKEAAEVEESPNKEPAEFEESPSNETAEVEESPSYEAAEVEESPSKETTAVIENREECAASPIDDNMQVSEVDLTKSNDGIVVTAPNSAVPNNDGVAKDSTVAEFENNLCNNTDQNMADIFQNNAQGIIFNKAPSKSPLPLDASNDNNAVKPNEEMIPECTSGTKTKNILSDLMEMSGIFDEDITPTDIPPSNVLPTDIPHVLQTHIQPTDQSPDIQLVDNLSTPQETEATTSPSGIFKPPVVNSPLGDLTPITSLYELKYACLNNGVFFKLDFETGYLVPINVCLKQQTKPNPPKKIQTKSVIDLTDDDDANNVNSDVASDVGSDVANDVTNSTKTLDQTVSGTSCKIGENVPSTSNITIPRISRTPNILLAPRKRSLLLVNNSDEAPTSVKPVKLFKSTLIHPRTLRKMHDKLFNVEVNTPKNISNLQPQSHTIKRKQRLQEDEIRYEIDLSTEDDEQPLKKLKMYTRKPKASRADEATETAILDASKSNELISDKETVPRVIATKDDSDDSSDEEPLANLVKRKRAEQTAPAPVNVIEVELQDDPEVPESNNDTNKNEIDMVPNVPIDNSKDQEIDVEPDKSNDNDDANDNEMELDPVNPNDEDDLNEMDMDLEEAQYELHFDSGSDEEGCILGV